MLIIINNVGDSQPLEEVIMENKTINLMYYRCGSCGKRFKFDDNGRCPHCQSNAIEIIDPTPTEQSEGGE